MDHANPFETPNTFKLHRLEYLVAWFVVIGFGVAHFGHIRWWVAAVLFFYIDIIGYLPGAIAYRRSPTHRISKGYYIAYNTMHSLVTQGAVIGLWMWLVKPEWALLAIPFHLFGDRSLFGNFLKPFGLPFEPEHGDVYERLVSGLSRDPRKIAPAAVPHRTPEPVR